MYRFWHSYHESFQYRFTPKKCSDTRWRRRYVPYNVVLINRRRDTTAISGQISRSGGLRIRAVWNSRGDSISSIFLQYTSPYTTSLRFSQKRETLRSKVVRSRSLTSGLRVLSATAWVQAAFFPLKLRRDNRPTSRSLTLEICSSRAEPFRREAPVNSLEKDGALIIQQGKVVNGAGMFRSANTRTTNDAQTHAAPSARFQSALRSARDSLTRKVNKVNIIKENVPKRGP